MLGCGIPDTLPDLSVLIVEENTNAVLGEDKVGEIWIRSGSKAKGYWNLPDESESVFNGIPSEGDMPVPDMSAGGYVKTGDYGFLHRKELFVTGRVKDLIIIRGRNHYPHDIERTLEDVVHEDTIVFRKGCSCAFSMPDQGEKFTTLHL